jgi:hypothetical protein
VTQVRVAFKFPLFAQVLEILLSSTAGTVSVLLNPEFALLHSSETETQVASYPNASLMRIAMMVTCVLTTSVLDLWIKRLASGHRSPVTTAMRALLTNALPRLLAARTLRSLFLTATIISVALSIHATLLLVAKAWSSHAMMEKNAPRMSVLLYLAIAPSQISFANPRTITAL